MCRMLETPLHLMWVQLMVQNSHANQIMHGRYLSVSIILSKLAPIRHAQTKLSVLASALMMYQSFVVGSHPGGCRHPEQVGCRWTHQSVEASFGPGSCAGFCYGNLKKINKCVKGAAKNRNSSETRPKTHSAYKGNGKSKQNHWIHVCQTSE